jgi:hypothetical protein
MSDIVMIMRPPIGPGPEPSPARRYMAVIACDQTDKAVARRVHIGGMTLEEAQDLLLVLAAQAPLFYDQCLAFEEETRS